MASSISTPRMPRPRGSSPIAARSASPDPEGDEALQLVAAAVDHAERRVARAGQLGGDPDQGLQDGVERQLRGDRDSGLDEPPPPLIAVHAAIQPCWPRSRTRLQADFIAMPPVPKPPTAKSGRNRNLIIALAVAAVVVAALIAGQRPALGRRRWGQRGDDRRDHRRHDRRHDREPAPPARRSRWWPGSRRTERCSGRRGTTVRMLQFEDLQCPICKRYTDDAFPAIVNEYVRTGRIKIDFRGLAFLGARLAEGTEDRDGRRASRTSSGRSWGSSTRTRVRRTPAG